MEQLKIKKSFRGGMKLPKFKGIPDANITDYFSLPALVVIPLRRGTGAVNEPLVQVGDEVRTGQVIACNNGEVATPVHASISGKVVAIEKRLHPTQKPTLSVVIEGDGRDEWMKTAEEKRAWEDRTSEEIGKVLYEAGVTGGGKGGFPTAYRSSEVPPEQIHTLVINAIETDPYLVANQQIVLDKQDEFLQGIRILRRALGDVVVLLGVDVKDQGLGKPLSENAKDWPWLTLCPLRAKYPQGEEEILLGTLLNINLPGGKTPVDAGVVVQDAAQVLAAYEAVALGKPFIERTISVGGDGVNSPRNLKVRVGTPIRAIADELAPNIPLRVAMNGLLKGVYVKNLESPVLRETAGLTLLTAYDDRTPFYFVRMGLNTFSYTRSFISLLPEKPVEPRLRGEERACLSCGYCIDVCPVGLVPTYLARYAEKKMWDEAQELDILACIDCNLCSYVCPCKISLAEQIKKGKRRVAKKLAKEEAAQAAVS
ncbi:RnfABCDGE type electron transport complex subunit C [candidate division KSB1 bacterium]|nr:RnfABCDGE type electron transport complex subunit C [candidate division KSB1 bacterium]